MYFVRRGRLSLKWGEKGNIGVLWRTEKKREGGFISKKKESTYNKNMSKKQEGAGE